MGIPCMVFSHEDIEAASALVIKNPKVQTEINIEKQTMTVGSQVFKGSIPDGSRGQLLNGSWDATFQLLENEAEVKAIANSLPYVNGWN